MTTLSPREWPAGLDSAGRPLAFVKVEIRDEHGLKAPRGAEGEIVVSGPNVLAAYFEERAKDAEAWDGRWLKTGDIGAWDAADRLVVLDRRTDRMVVGGENVSPAEVERVLRLHPSVLEVAVAGVPAGSWGHDIAAAVVLRPRIPDAGGAPGSRHGSARRFQASAPAPHRGRAPAKRPRESYCDALRDLFRDEVPQEEPA